MSTGGEILLIEDHRDIAEMVFDYLENQGYTVDYAADGVTGLHLGIQNDYDAVVLDLMLPGIDGLDVCRRLRRDAHVDAPVLMLTARDTLEDKLLGFESGADDYLVKPFDLEELEARLGSLIRRRRGDVAREVLRVGELTLDLQTLKVMREEHELTVSPIGIKILTVLMQRSPKVVDRWAIERVIWGDLPPDSDALRSHMYNLRKVVDKPFTGRMIYTVHSAGFRIVAGE
ncbi:MAG: response regulator transcription factor [Gammaproteobacteria bacterium]|nr:response regulator transcription factor [Gammaproteobacteria bacterium]